MDTRFCVFKQFKFNQYFSIKDKAVEGREKFYDWLTEHINIDGIIEKERDTEFDDLEYYRSGGIRLKYENKKAQSEAVFGVISLLINFL